MRVRIRVDIEQPGRQPDTFGQVVDIPEGASLAMLGREIGWGFERAVRQHQGERHPADQGERHPADQGERHPADQGRDPLWWRQREILAEWMNDPLDTRWNQPRRPRPVTLESAW